MIQHFRLAFLLILMGTALRAQIVNIESLRSSIDSNGFYGVENFNVGYTRNTRELLKLDNNLTLQYKRDRNMWMFLNTLDISLAGKEKLEQNLFFHLRYNYRQNNWLTYEALSQYQQNQPLKIQDRILFGGGTRFTLKEKKHSKLFLGTLILYEFDNELNNDIIHRDFRLSNYISSYLAVEDRLKWTVTLYYQPRLDYWRDYRTSLQSQLSIGILKKLSYVSVINLTYDAFPVEAVGIPNLTVKWTNGFSYRF